MDVKLYRYTGDFRKADKSSGLTLLINYTATYLKEPESVRSIQLRLQYSDQATKNEILKANMIYIPDLSRWYEVRPESVLDLGGIIKLTCEEDDIMSNLSDVLNLKAVIKRQENRFNTYLNDEKYKAYEYSRIQTLEFPQGFTEQAFVLAIAGGGD